MSRTKYDDTYSYEIFDDGYDIYKNDNVILTQRDPYGKVFIPDGTYEENAIKQLYELTHPAPIPPSQEEKNRADIDYMALMLDIDLPSEEEEGE